MPSPGRNGWRSQVILRDARKRSIFTASTETFYFVDLPGYGYARVPPQIVAEWKKLIESYLLERKTLKLACLILDARRGWMEKDLELKKWLEHQQRRYLVIATKTDKLNQTEQERGTARHPQEGVEPLPFSAAPAGE